MASYAKGVCVTSCKDVFLVANLVSGALTKLIVAGRDLLDEPSPMKRREIFEAPSSLDIHPSTGSIDYQFTFAGIRRHLTIHLECDVDHKDLGHSTLSLMLGDFGDAELFLRTALTALRVLGPVHLRPTENSDYAELPLPETRFGDLLAEGILSGYVYDKLMERSSRTNLHVGRSMWVPKEFGYGHYAYRQLIENASDASKRWAAIKNELVERGYGSPAFQVLREKAQSLTRERYATKDEAVPA